MLRLDRAIHLILAMALVGLAACGGDSTPGVCDDCADLCTNGVQEGDETDIDCGGACLPCALDTPHVVANPDRLDLEATALGQSSTFEVTLVNDGTAPATIANVTLSGVVVSGVTIEPESAIEFEVSELGVALPFVLAPGGSLKFSVTHTELDAVGAVAKIVVEFNDGQPQLDIYCYTDVYLAPQATLDIRLTWQDDTAVPPNEGADLDLHFVKAAPLVAPIDARWFDDVLDCYWNNRSPSWVEGFDNPKLLRDSHDGSPEEIWWENPAPGTYIVGVHGHDMKMSGSATASVEIHVEGVLVQTISDFVAKQDDMWAVGQIVVTDLAEPGAVVPDLHAAFEGFGQPAQPLLIEGLRLQ